MLFNENSIVKSVLASNLIATQTDTDTSMESTDSIEITHSPNITQEIVQTALKIRNDLEDTPGHQES